MDIDYAEYLAAEAASPLAALHQFKVVYRDEDDSIHLFFEGEEDSLYYVPEIRRRAGPRRLHVYVCGGKRRVIEARDAIADSGYRLKGCLFFIDRDFDDYLNLQPALGVETYITETYSFENELVQTTALDIVLLDLIRIPTADPEFEAIRSRYVSSYARFVRSIRPLMGWCVATKQAGGKPNLNNANLAKLFDFRECGRVDRSPGFLDQFRRQTVAGEAGANWRAVRGWCARFALEDAKLWIRGKYELWFFETVLLKLINEANIRRKAAGGKAWKVPAAVRERRLLEVLGGRLPPSSLT